jgi:hypothetical protein
MMGLTRAWRAGAGRAFGLGPLVKDRVFFEFIFNAKTIPEKSRNCFKGTKNTRKNPGKFPEIDWSMNNPNKVFGAHEKDLGAF